MRTARDSAINLLKLMMVASLVLPVALFAFAGWLDYRHETTAADERITRSAEILHEHALKVFETIERAIAEVEEVVRDLSDRQIIEREQQLHERFQKIVNAMPQLQGIVIADRMGNRLCSSASFPTPKDLGFADRDFFKAQAERDAGTYVSEVLIPRQQTLGSHFFNLSRRRTSSDGSFNGIVLVAAKPSYFEEFYARIGRSPGSLYSMARSDGIILARYPSRVDAARNLDASSAFRQEIAKGLDEGIYTAPSQIDGIERRVAYRKLLGFPVYVTAGVETRVIWGEWRSDMGSHLIFGLPATLLLFGIIGVALQRTRRLYAEADRREAADVALRQAQRLQAIGQLTGGVAHDFNNLLMVVNGSVHRLQRDLTDDKHKRLLGMITTATARGESLTRQLLAFSRRQMLMPVVIDLTQRLPELKELLDRSLRGDIETTVSVPDGPSTVKVDSSELELALLNLAVNARDAMPNGGSLSIKARPVTLKGRATEEGLSGEFVAIRVTDTGHGIPADILPHVFEPFFTTKEIGKGTGLGLSQAYGFARQSGGVATISSHGRRGTTVTLYLPTTRELPIAAPPTEPSKVVTKKAGTVLLVEDNDEVADVCRSYWEQLGYTVIRAASAKEALSVLENEKNIDLVFSDILMPGVMNGLELAHAVRERFPRLPVLLATGYSNSFQDAHKQGFIVLLKPFDLAKLEQGLRDVMSSHQRRQAAEAVS